MITFLGRTFRFSLKFVFLFLLPFTFLALLSPHLSPKTTIYPALASLTFPVLVFFHLLFIWFWWRRKSSLRWVSVLVWVSFIPTLPLYFQLGLGGSPLSGNTHDLKVMTCNVSTFRYVKKDNTAFKNLLKSEQPEILALQEYERNKKRSKMYADSIMLFSDLNYFSNPKQQNQVLFSKYPIVNDGYIDFEKSSNGIAFADVVVNKDTIRVYSAHLQSNRISHIIKDLTDNPDFRDRETLTNIRDMARRFRDKAISRDYQMRQLAERLHKCPYPFVVLGDFNDVPLSATYNLMRQQGNDAYRSGGFGIGATYRGNVPWLRIDYIFTSPTLFSTSYQRHKVNVSDHYPVSTTVFW